VSFQPSAISLNQRVADGIANLSGEAGSAPGDFAARPEVVPFVRIDGYLPLKIPTEGSLLMAES
jgi:hypothetical protein